MDTLLNDVLQYLFKFLNHIVYLPSTTKREKYSWNIPLSVKHWLHTKLTCKRFKQIGDIVFDCMCTLGILFIILVDRNILLRIACLNGNVKVVQCLLNQPRIDPSFGNFRYTPLEIAMYVMHDNEPTLSCYLLLVQHHLTYPF